MHFSFGIMENTWGASYIYFIFGFILEYASLHVAKHEISQQQIVTGDMGKPTVP